MRGVLAPGHQSAFEAGRVAHHNLSEPMPRPSTRTEQRGGTEIGIVVNLEPQYARIRRRGRSDCRGCTGRCLLQSAVPRSRSSSAPTPIELRDDIRRADRRRARGRDGDAPAPMDFLGVNYYSRSVVRADAARTPARSRARVPTGGSAHTEMGWEVYPAGLTAILRWVRERYGPVPMYVTENGAAFRDPPRRTARRSRIHSASHYYRSHMRAAHAAMAEGVDLRGYFAWSLLDNFEWNYGYPSDSALIHVDCATQRRAPSRPVPSFIAK